MTTSQPDVADLLRQQLKYHQEQIRRIETALATLEPSHTQGIHIERSIDKPVAWTKEIHAALEAMGKIEFSKEELDEKLIARGIPPETLEKHRNTLSGTLSRMKSQGLIDRKGGMIIYFGQNHRSPYPLEADDIPF